MTAPVHQQLHGYRGGHQLLASSLALGRQDQDLIDRLSDLSGPLSPGQEFGPYITTYALSSGDFYVVARTWQDKTATRAGCVLTRSLLVPMTNWLNAPSMPFLLDALCPVDKQRPIVSDLMVVDDQRPLAPVRDSRTTELVEALFLEARQPIVMFDIDSADAIIARLLTALWPSIRRQFSTCGFALAPRSVDGRPFDFLVASSDARVRFSDWTGRKIDDYAVRSPRHRWTEPMVERIFLDPSPNLSTLDTLGVLDSDPHNGVAWRLVLLWNELLEKSKTSPNAALGLLDILASQNVLETSRSILSILDQAVRLSVETNSVSEHLRFLLTLLGKYFGRVAPLSLLRLVRSSTESASRRDLIGAFEYLLSVEDLGRPLPRIFCAGFGDAIADMPDSTFDGDFSRLMPAVRLALMSASDKLAQRIVSSLRTVSRSEWEQVIQHTLELPQIHLRVRAANRLVRKLDHADQLAVLQGVLWSASWVEIARALEQLWKACEFVIPEFDRPIIHAAATVGAIHQLRSAICDLPTTMATDRLLTKTLQFGEPDIDWLLASEDLAPHRKSHLMAALVSSADDQSLSRVFSNARLRTGALGLLVETDGVDILAIAKLLVTIGIVGPEQFEIAFDVLGRIDNRDLRRALALPLLKSLFSHSRGSERWPRGVLLEALGSLLTAEAIIDTATDKTISAEQLCDNIEMLNAFTDVVRSEILQRIDLLSKRLVKFPRIFFDQKATVAWADLITGAGTVNRSAQLEAAELVLPFALKMKHGPASSLLIATFPLVHAELARGETAPGLMSFFLFGDYWDRCDVLRRRLVEAFVESKWPPADLLLVARAANVVREVMNSLASHHRGREYQKAIVEDLGRLSAELQDGLRDLLQEGRRKQFGQQ
jgi:hypothetical protein